MIWPPNPPKSPKMAQNGPKWPKIPQKCKILVLEAENPQKPGFKPEIPPGKPEISMDFAKIRPPGDPPAGPPETPLKTHVLVLWRDNDKFRALGPSGPLEFPKREDLGASRGRADRGR